MRAASWLRVGGRRRTEARMRGRPIQEIAVGDAAELTRVATPGDVAQFIDSVGDRNPIHHDHAYAASTRFEKPIVPGMWTASLLSTVLGTQLPGPGCVYVSLQIAFTRPVYFGDRITARVEVVERLPDRNRVRLKAVCANQDRQQVLIGETVLSPSKKPVVYNRRETGSAQVVHWALQPTLWAAQATSAWARLGAAWVSAWRREPSRDRTTRANDRPTPATGGSSHRGLR
ncbi:MAG: MaoC family dehydratase [Chloroflexi bacterium]|nr:MaoC family dehydratase [Chloroflexota bacterium]